MRKLRPLALATSAGLLAAVPALLPAGASAAEGPVYTDTAKGVVFEDLDSDGTRDAGEPGVPDVSVSNGRDVVRTDAQGAWRLGVTDQTIVFVTKPADYLVPVDDVQLPQFFYRHFPNGSPFELTYGGVAPTGPLPDSVDFPLVRDLEASDRFEALVFADPQTRSLGELADFDTDVVQELIGSDAKLGITAGDIVNDPLDLFGPHNEIVAKIGVPWLNLPGNHDMDYDAPTDANATDTYKQVYGPTDYSADYGKVHFVNLDNVDYFGVDNPRGDGGYRGFLRPDQLEWLRNDLAFVPADRLIMISTHIPLRTDAIGGDAVNTVNLPDLFEVLDGRQHLWSVSGHDTSNSWQKYIGPDGGWNGDQPFLSQTLAEVRGGGWDTGPLDDRGVQAADMADGNPNGYYTVAFDGNRFTPRYKAASLPADYQIRLSFEGGRPSQTFLPTGPSGSGGISPAPRFHPRDFDEEQGAPVVTANVFDAGEKNVVEASVDGGTFRRMSYDPPVKGLTNGQSGGNLDPYLSDLFARLARPQRPARPEPSSHLWTTTLPSGLAPGRHVLTVRSTDPYGQVSTASQTFEVVAGAPTSPRG